MGFCLKHSLCRRRKTLLYTLCFKRKPIAGNVCVCVYWSDAASGADGFSNLHFTCPRNLELLITKGNRPIKQYKQLRGGERAEEMAKSVV